MGMPQAAPAARLRFAAHLGFPLPDQPLFGALADPTPLAQIALAADLGFAGVLDPFAMMRTPEDQEAIGYAARLRGLAMGGFLYAPLARVRMLPAWTDPNVPVDVVRHDLEVAFAAANRLGSRDIAIIAVRASAFPFSLQCMTMAERLRQMAPLAEAGGMTLHIEPVSADRLPDMLLHSMEATANVVKAANHPSVRIAFDTGHVHANGEDIGDMLQRYWPLIGIVQFADAPGRVELGAGAIDFGRVFGILRALQYQGLCELEHTWAKGGAIEQRHYAAWLGALAEQG